MPWKHYYWGRAPSRYACYTLTSFPSPSPPRRERTILYILWRNDLRRKIVPQGQRTPPQTQLPSKKPKAPASSTAAQPTPLHVTTTYKGPAPAPLSYVDIEKNNHLEPDPTVISILLPRRRYSLAAFILLVANYSAAMEAYHRHLWNKALPLLNMLPDDSRVRGVSLHQEAMSLAKQECTAE